jgi:hypothetical protein
MKNKTKLSAIFLFIFFLFTIASADVGIGISDVGTISSVTGIDDEIAMPVVYRLNQNYPNPFNPITIIHYQLPKTSDVELSVYNLLGQKVATLVSERQQSGQHQVKWDATNFVSGIYYYFIQAGEFHQVRKMILIK